MAEPIITQIRDNLVTTINNQTSGDGVTFTAITPSRLGQILKDGTVVVHFGERHQNPEVQGENVEEWMQEFVFEFQVVLPEQSSADVDTLITTREADIRKLLNADITRGNLAHDTTPLPPEWFTRQAGQHEGGNGRCYVRYRTVYGDPYTAR